MPRPMPMPAFEQNSAIGPWLVSVESIRAWISASTLTSTWRLEPPIQPRPRQRLSRPGPQRPRVWRLQPQNGVPWHGRCRSRHP